MILEWTFWFHTSLLLLYYSESNSVLTCSLHYLFDYITGNNFRTNRTRNNVSVKTMWALKTLPSIGGVRTMGRPNYLVNFKKIKLWFFSVYIVLIRLDASSFVLLKLYFQQITLSYTKIIFINGK